VGKEIEIAGVGFDGVAFEAFFLLTVAEKTIRNGVAGFGDGGVFKAIDGGVEIAFVHVVLADLQITFCAEGIPGWLVGSVLGGVVGGGVGLGLWRVFGRRRLGGQGQSRDQGESCECDYREEEMAARSRLHWSTEGKSRFLVSLPARSGAGGMTIADRHEHDQGCEPATFVGLSLV